MKTKKRSYKFITPEVSDGLRQEQAHQKHWEKTKTCTFGDMNYSRHIGPQPYINNLPCGNKCESCGTFWID